MYTSIKWQVFKYHDYENHCANVMHHNMRQIRFRPIIFCVAWRKQWHDACHLVVQILLIDMYVYFTHWYGIDLSSITSNWYNIKPAHGNLKFYLWLGGGKDYTEWYYFALTNI